MGYLLPQIPRSPAHRVLHPVLFGDVAPAAAAALRTEQLLQPFIAEHQYRIGLNQQLRLAVAHAPLLQLLRRDQVQEIFFAVAFNVLVRMCRAEQLAPSWPPVASAGTSQRLLAPKQPNSGRTHTHVRAVEEEAHHKNHSHTAGGGYQPEWQNAFGPAGPPGDSGATIRETIRDPAVR